MLEETPVIGAVRPKAKARTIAAINKRQCNIFTSPQK
jgi:hypothetical protein